MANHAIKVSTLDENIKVYDLEGNIIKQIPEPPEIPPKVKYFNIVEYEDRLMGIDPDAKPDFFIDFENDENIKAVFEALNEDPHDKAFDRLTIFISTGIFLIMAACFVMGYVTANI